MPQPGRVDASTQVLGWHSSGVSGGAAENTGAVFSPSGDALLQHGPDSSADVALPDEEPDQKMCNLFTELYFQGEQCGVGEG